MDPALDLAPARSERGSAQRMTMTPEELWDAIDDAQAMRARRAVLLKWARVCNGRPLLCLPSAAELRGDAPHKTTWGTNYKVIYDSEYKARLAARELESLGSEPMRFYPCDRSRHGHVHLTKDKSRIAKSAAKKKKR
jgi:hypothetical protein